MYSLALQTSIATASSVSSCSQFGGLSRPSNFPPKALAANINNLRLSTRGGGSARASSADVTTQTAKAPITFQVGETSLTLPFSAKAAKGLSDAIDKLLITFKEREKATRPQRWQTMEYRQNGDDGVSFEFFCNPNAYANAFQAKVLITVNDDKIKVTTEGQLSALKSDVEQYVDKSS
ncbi:hypothetical protein MPTK1_7g15950 [Marchantia polymorpha subsp. ruderalis]|uniref:Uncharacterized protein n=2 Tax=Marchantia polymorpha TaxID=3197 RepID=A0A176VJA8_MARPO|nr:hypothetical protein AXG93_2024s1060 [Marchantia polymorpha subsp. ruderalis]PTQ31464.1 hypothetical protein MARPO_0111s0024 [Marchantia polymorpha]BBN17637.1 hypothetical protein Mp_7g15950 [Marchantia polymorpha subsp. ruderalis]|eukprot:PTQ31464.1 hypothetical protein MARPO_0111s0024 [Marchantia polymorpha]